MLCREAAKKKEIWKEGEIDTGLPVFAMQYPNVYAMLCYAKGGLLAANTDCGCALSRYSAVTQ